MFSSATFDTFVLTLSTVLYSYFSFKLQSLQEAMTARRKSGFPLKRVVFLVLVAVGGFIYYDCNTKGGWNSEYWNCDFVLLVIKVEENRAIGMFV